MNMVFKTEDSVLNYLKENNCHSGDMGMFCQWKDGGVEPLSEAIWNANPNDWWYFINNGECRVWLHCPSEEEISSEWESTGAETGD